MVSHGEMKSVLSATGTGTDPPQRSSLFHVFRGEEEDSSGLCFADSDDEFNIDDFRCRIDNIEAELSSDGPLGGHSLDDQAREAKHFWDTEKEALSSTANLLETLGSTGEAGDLETGFICESDEEAMRKLVGQDPSLGSLVLLYGLKSDAILSRERERSEPGTGSRRKGGHSLDMDVDQFEMTEERGVAEMVSSDFYDQSPHLGSEVATAGCGDDTMTLFYEFQNLPYIDPATAADDVDSPSDDQTSTTNKFHCVDEMNYGGGFEGDLKSLSRGRKRGLSIELTPFDDALTNRFVVTESSAYSSSQATTGLTHGSNQYPSLPVKQATGSTASSSSSSFSDVSWVRVQANFPPEKRAKFSPEERPFVPMQTNPRTGAKWNGNPTVGISESIAHLQPFPDVVHVGRGSEYGCCTGTEGSGWHQGPNTTFAYGLPPPGDFDMWTGNSDRERFEDKGRATSTDGMKQHPASVLDSLPAGPAAETVWTMPGSLCSSSQFNEAQLLHHVVAPSAANSADDLSSLQSAWKGLNDASLSFPLDTIIASFLSSCSSEVAGNVGDKNQHNNHFSEARGQLSVNEIQNPTSGLIPDARRRISEEIPSGWQGHVPGSTVPCPVSMTDRTKATPDRSMYEVQRSRLVADRSVAQMERAGCHPGQSSAPAWSLPASPASGIPLSVGSVPLLPAMHGLPFPLPPVPSGYKLVITHQSLPPAGKESTQPQKETRIIIIHPAQETPPATGIGHPFITNYQSPPPSSHLISSQPPHSQSEMALHKPGTAVPQFGSKPPVSGTRRPADFDLPQKTSVQCFHHTDHGSKSSSPLTPALDLSLNSFLAQASYPERIATQHQTAAQTPAHQNSPYFTDALWRNGMTGTQDTMTSSHAMFTGASQGMTNSDARISMAQSVCPTPSGDSRVCLPTRRLASNQFGHQSELLPTAARSNPVAPADRPTEGHLVDVMFPPNVVIGPSCGSDQRLISGRLSNAASTEDLSSPVAHVRRPSSEIGSGGGTATGRPLSPAITVEPDSTVQPGQRDIIRALTDKLRRNRTQRRISDNLVSTTSQSPNAANPFLDGLSPHPEQTLASPNQHPNSEQPASESAEVPPTMHQLHQQHLSSDAVTSRFADVVTVAADPAQIGIKAELPASPTSAADRPSSMLTSSSSAAHHHLTLEESGVHRNRQSAAESNHQMVNGMLEWSASSNGENSSDRDKSFDGKSLNGPTESDRSDFCFFLDAPISTAQRLEEDRITYLNKGQYYRLSLECLALPYQSENVIFKSVVMVLFRDSRAVGDELEAWKIWHTRQQSYKQRILDIDYKDACGVGLNSMKELAYNATALTWSTADQPVKVNVAVNCLSTDFSNQKGVKGIPLHIQIDTYDLSTPDVPIHRAYCKIKVFCDKGAERKVRDEERKREKRNKVKSENSQISEMQESCCTSLRQSNFQPVEDLTREPIFFIPSNDVILIKAAATEKKTQPAPTSSCGASRNSSGNATSEFSVDEHQTAATVKRSRPASIVVSREYQRVLLYVREMQEEVFTALLLQTPTVPALAQAIHEKCNIEANKIKNIYKKSKKGILVKMDDKILRHYSNESTFIITTTVTHSSQSNSDSIMYDVILAEIDVDTH